jgi:HSP20 family protein
MTHNRIITAPTSPLGVIEALFANAFGHSSLHRGALSGSAQVDDVPTDLFEDASGFYAQLELPGVKKEDIALTLDKADLKIALVTKVEDGANGENSEDGHATSERVLKALRLPDTVNREGITAAHRDGILTITVPKAEQKAPVVIKVD